MKSSSYIVLICLILFLPLFASAQDGLKLSGQAKLGYLFIDDDGKMSTTPEIFQIYSGFTLENLNLKGIFKKNASFELDFSNINQDNRSLSFSLRRPGLFSLTSQCNQSRFIFDKEGKIKSERTFATISGYFQPTKFLKLKSDFSHHLKEGDRRTYFDGLGIGGGEYDQFFWSVGFGGQLKFGKRFLDFQYRLRSLDDRKNDLQDREGSQIRTTLNLPLHQKIFLSLQYLHDENKLSEFGSIGKKSELELKSDLYNLSILYQPIRRIVLSTKFLFQRTENQSTQITSNILRGGGEISYEFYRGYRLNWGYEYEKREDQAESDEEEAETIINTYLVGAYAKFIPELSLKARYVFQDRKDEDKVTTTGPYEDEKILVELKSKPTKEVNLKLRYEDKRRDNPDILTSICDKGFVSYLSITLKKWFGLYFNYSLLDVEYKNTVGKFKTDNKTFSSQITLKPFDKLNLKGGWNHLDIRGDLDIRKEGVWFGFDYGLMDGYSLEGKYNAYDYDDYLYLPENYVANVYTISLVKKFGGI
ncbi:MAG: hypothetical protein ACE5K2_06825 [Candidatus Zixiibacteriota bacterium]